MSSANARSGTGLSFRLFLPELLLYAALVTGYFYLVLLLLDGWLARIHEDRTLLYAAVSLLLILGQGFALERLTHFLVRLVARVLG